MEQRVDPDLANDTFELDRCIECEFVLLLVGTLLMRPNFVGPVGLNRVARFDIDPHDKKNCRRFL